MMKKTIISLFITITVILTLYTPHTITINKTNTLDNKRIVIDPGHGGKDCGAKYGDLHESDLNLKISFALKKELESRGATVYLTRTDDQDMTKRDYNYSKADDMYLRAIKIDEYQPDLFLSIHLNSAVSSAWGSQVFYFDGSIQGEKLAECIHNSMKKVTGTKKSISSCHFQVLRATSSLGVLVECGFISNANERGQLKNSKYHKKLADCISDGIEEYIKTLIII